MESAGATQFLVGVLDLVAPSLAEEPGGGPVRGVLVLVEQFEADARSTPAGRLLFVTQIGTQSTIQTEIARKSTAAALGG